MLDQALSGYLALRMARPAREAAYLLAQGCEAQRCLAPVVGGPDVAESMASCAARRNQGC
jgi:hypothetical protein